MNFVSDGSYLHIGIVVSVFAVMCLLTYFAIVLSDLIVRKLGNNVITVIGKIMGLIIAIIGTNMVIVGVTVAFKL